MNDATTKPQEVSGECPSREVLSDLALGKLPMETIDTLDQHIEACSTCQGILETLDVLEDSVIADIKGQTGPLPPDPQLQQQIREAEQISRVVWGEPKPDTPGEPSPKHLGQYEVLEKIGQGGMGTVYKALHTRLKRLVAVKILPAHRLADPRAVARFFREMEAVGRLDHPNLVRAHDAGEAEGQHFLVMEYIGGIDLRELVRRSGPLVVADACEIIRQAAMGLQHAHEHDLVHRDVKPSNLMLTLAGIVKLLDLGLARLRPEMPVDGDVDVTASGQIMGSADYMAPEQCLDARDVNARADIYSLGCTLYFLLTGRPPFATHQYGTIGKKLLAHAQQAIPSIRQFRNDIPPGLVAVLERMLAKDPEHRPPTAADVVAAVEPFAAGADLSARLARPLDRTDKGNEIATGIHDQRSSVTARHGNSRRIGVAAGGLMLVVALLGGPPIVRWLQSNKRPVVADQSRGAAVASDSNENRPVSLAASGPLGKRESNEDAGSRAASAYLTRAEVSGPVREAMLTVLRQHPGETRWSGRSGSSLFAIAVKRLPGDTIRQQTGPALLNLTHMLAVQELLMAKSLLDRYAESGLTDATTLRQAVLQAAGGLEVTGKVRGVQHQATSQGDFSVAYVLADESALSAHLLQPVELEQVRTAYRNAMHTQARNLMQRSNWKDAILLWQHLHTRKLVSPGLYLDAARCFKELGQDRDVVRVLGEAINTFGPKAGPEFLERAGDLALTIQTEEGQKLAEQAYRGASEGLREQISQHAIGAGEKD